MLQNDNLNKDFIMRRVIKNKKGYTLVELIVVMGIVGLLLTLTFGGYASTRKEKYVGHVANLTQTNIRDTFIDVLSTKVESSLGTCNRQSPQIKAVRIKLGSGSNAPTNPVSKVAMCNDTNGNLLSPDVVEPDIDPSSGLNYKQPIEVKCDKCNNSFPATQGYLYLIFTSPYGKYYYYWTNNPDSVIADTEFFQRGSGYSGVGWQKDNNLIYVPKSGRWNNAYYDFIVTFDSDTTSIQGIVHKITISKNGSIKLD